jgi:uncharacterized membrane protein HdeD (DUF308 family)
MSTPEPTSQAKTLRRVLLVSAIDGWSIVAIAGLGTLITLALGDLVGLVVGVLVLAAGVIELRGRRQLQRRDPNGMRLLIRAQLLLLTVILVYCVSRLGSFDADTAMANLTPEMEAILKENGLERADVLPLVQTAFYATYSIVAVVSVIFQGGLTLYYRSRAAAVTAALTPTPEPINPSVL